jgi:tripartite-type tricarboxylate transporter receptor subunit TctC
MGDRPAGVTRLALGLMLTLTLIAACAGGETTDTTEGAQPTTTAGQTSTPEDPTTTVASDWEPEFVDGVLQPLPDGFPNQPITLINVDDAGTNTGLYVRAIQQAIQDGGLSPVDIRISDEPRAQGGSLHTLAEVADSREGGMDGYQLVSVSVAGTSTDFHVEPVTNETGLTMEDVNFFVSTDQTPYIMISRLDAPWGEDFDAFIEYARANGDQVRHLTRVGNFNSIAGEWMLAAFGIDPVDVPVTDRDQALAAVGAGEGDITFTQPLYALQGEGRVITLWVSGFDVPEEFAGAGSLNDHAEYGVEQLVLGTINGFILPTGVDEDHVAWLHALIAAAAEQESYMQREETTPGLVVRVLSSEQTNELAMQAYTDMEDVIRESGAHWEDR